MHEQNKSSHYSSLTAVTLLTCLIICSAFIADIPAIADYPNYLARLYLVVASSAGDQHPYYELTWSLIPNLAFDLLVLYLAKWMSVAAATKTAFIASEILIVLGAIAIEVSVKGRHEIAGFVALVGLYSAPFMVGLLNFEIGLGLALLAIAFWISSARISAPIRFMVHSSAVLILFFAHYLAFGIYGLTVGLYESYLIWERGKITKRDVVTFLGLAAPVAVLLVLIKLFSPAVGIGDTEWTFATKAAGLLYSLSGYSIVLSGLGSMALILAGYGLRKAGVLKLSRHGMWMACGFAIAVVLMPTRLFGSFYVDTRLLISALLILPAFVHLSLTARGMNILRTSIAVYALIGAGYSTWIWMSYRDDFARLISSFTLLDRGSRVLIGETEIREAKGLGGDPFRHAPTLAAHYADALVPSLFTMPGAQPLRLRPTAEHLAPTDSGLYDSVPLGILSAGARAEIGSPSSRFMNHWQQKFDYLYMIGKPSKNPFPLFLTEIANGQHFALYRITR